MTVIHQSDAHLTDLSGSPLCGAPAVERHWAPIELDDCDCEPCFHQALDILSDVGTEAGRGNER